MYNVYVCLRVGSTISNMFLAAVSISFAAPLFRCEARSVSSTSSGTIGLGLALRHSPASSESCIQTMYPSVVVFCLVRKSLFRSCGGSANLFCNPNTPFSSRANRVSMSSVVSAAISMNRFSLLAINADRSSCAFVNCPTGSVEGGCRASFPMHHSNGSL